MEDRLCPTGPYSYTLIAQTGSSVLSPSGSTVGALSNMSLPSINDAGQVAFLGTINGFNGVDEWTPAGGGPATLTAISFTNRNFTFPQIDNKGDVIAQDQSSVGTTLESYIRLWHPSGTFTDQYTGSADTGVGDVVLIPTLSPNGTQIAYQDNLLPGLVLDINGAPVHTFPSGSGGLRPLIANNGMVVVRDGSTTTSPIMVFRVNGGPVTIANSSTFSLLGNNPGIDANGNVVTFYGNLADAAGLNAQNATSISNAKKVDASFSLNVAPLTAGSGIFASIPIDGNGDRVMVLVAGTSANGFSGFPDARVMPTSSLTFSNTNVLTGGSITVAFEATDTAGNQGIYTNAISIKGGMVAVDSPIVVVNSGQMISGVGQVTGVSEYVPINTGGQIAFIANTAASQAVVQASNASSVLPTNLVFDKKMGGVDLQYQVTGAALTQDVPVAFYWATSPRILDEISQLSYTYTIKAGTPDGPSAPVPVAGMNLTGAPKNATYLLAVTDPKNVLGNYDPNKNVFALGLQLQVAPLYQKYDQSGSLTTWARTPLGLSPTDTIGNQGCTLTGLAMQLSYAGMASDPETLNKLLKDSTSSGVNAYDFGTDGYRDRLKLSIATAIAAGIAGPPKLQWVAANTTNAQGLRDLLLKSAAPILVKVFNPTSQRTHYVLVTGLAGNDDFTINDPGYRARTLLSFYGGFTGVGYIKDPPDLSILDVSAVSDSPDPGVIIVDAQGRSTGTDSSTGQTLTQIPNSTVFIDGPQENLDGPQDNSTSTAQFVDIYQPLSGSYSIRLLATMPPTYLDIIYITPAGLVQKTVQVQGVGGTTIQFSLEGGQIITTSTPPSVTAPSNQNTTEGVSQGFTLGSFIDSGSGPWNVDVQWGDGGPDTKFAANTPGALGMQSHTYAEEGSQTVTVTVTNAADNLSSSKTFQASVSDPAVIGTPLKVNTTTGTAFTGPVATFTDPGGAEAVDGTHYTASIDWGDKTTATAGTITVSGSTFTVSGSHTYASGGSYTITCAINHEGILTTVQSSATVGTATQPPPVVTAPANQNAVEGASQAFNLGAFSDAASGPWNVSVKWGDGTPDTTFGATGPGSLAQQKHTFGEEGSYTITVMVANSADGASGSKTFQVIVADAALQASGAAISPVAGKPFSGVVASFTDADPGGTASDYSATINWGDGNTSTGTIAANGSGGFNVAGSHAYANPGPFTLSVQISDAGGSKASSSSPITVTSQGTTAPVVTCLAINPTAGAPFSGVVASFTDTDGGSLSSYTARLDWGDGTTTAGTIAVNGKGGFNISSNHTYASHGPFTLSVEVDDTDGTNGKGTVSITAAVTGQSSTPNQNATINFWASTHGQSLLKSFNGGASSTALATWLATSFPNLYGANAGTNNLIGKTNAQVAALFTSFYAEARPKPDAQALALALDIYATTSSLGGTAGSAYGFRVSSTGLGACLVSLGTNGAAFDAPNNVAVTAYYLLTEANKQAVNGVLYSGNSALLQQFLNVVVDLNDTGMNC